MNQTQQTPTIKANYDFLIEKLKKMGYPHEYAVGAVHSLPPKLQTPRAIMQAILKCREWLYNPFLRDCPPVNGIMAAFPNHWVAGEAISQDEVQRAAEEYNRERGIIVHEEGLF